MSLHVLDCTLRDGGYYTKWDFNHKLVERYFSAISHSNIDIIEVGFRFLSKNGYFGPFAYTTDHFLRSLPLTNNVKIAVMINAGEFITNKAPIEKLIDSIFSEKKDSPVNIVRIATNAHEISDCEKIVGKLNRLGYEVHLNIMKISSIEPLYLSNLLKLILEWDKVQVIYIADSFGNMMPDTIKDIISRINKIWKGDLGIHAHDNKGLALINSLTAIDSGVNYVDSTIRGMGRGAGNTKTENLLTELNNKNNNFFVDKVFDIATQDFEQLQKIHGWGASLYYYLSANYSIHPTYVQQLLEDERYGPSSIISAIESLKNQGADEFNFEKLLCAVSDNAHHGTEKGTWSANDWLSGQDVLIIANGESSKLHLSEIKAFVKRSEPYVLCINDNKFIPPSIISAYIACHETRIPALEKIQNTRTKQIILPLSRIPKRIQQKIQELKVLDYGMRIDSESTLKISDFGCVISSPLAVIYAISVAAAAGASRILLTGIDGFPASDYRQQEMVRIIQNFKSINPDVKLVAITPTTYPLSQQSVYNPSL